MLIKRRSRLVIFWSCLLIAIVFVLSLGGYYGYIIWQEEESRKEYEQSLRDLNAKIYSKYIIVSSIVAKLGEDDIFMDRPIIEGGIKNISSKKVSALALKVDFLDEENAVVYLDSFEPLGEENYLLPNDSVSFRHVLKNVPSELYDHLARLKSFAKDKEPLKITLRVQLEGLDIR